MDVPAHNRNNPPLETAHLPEHIRKGLVCLEAVVSVREFLPTQTMRCPCKGMDLGDWLKRQYAAARGGVLHPDAYERMRAAGVLFPLGDARRTDSVVVIRDKAVRIVPYQSPDYATYQRMVWDEAFVRAFQAVTDDGINLNRLKVDKFDKNSANLDQMLFNVRQAYQRGDLPGGLVDGFTQLGLCLSDEDLEAYLDQPEVAIDILASQIARDLIKVRGAGFDLTDVLTRAVARA